MVKAEYTPESRLTTSQKDVRLMLEQGQRFGTPMFLTSMHAHIVQIGVQMGLAELDPSSVIEVLRGMSGLPLRKREGNTRERAD